MNKKARSIIYSLLAAFIWGTTFTAQSMLSEHMTPFFINCCRSVIAAIVLLIICLFIRKKTKLGAFKDIAIGSLCCGTALFLAANLQQMAIGIVSSGEAAFMTSLYTVLVPIFGLFLGRKVNFRVWIAVGIFVAGTFLLCGGPKTFAGGFGAGELYLVLSAICFAVQILLISHFTEKVNGIALSCGQFFVVASLSFGAGMLLEDINAQDIGGCVLPLLYAAILSSCIAYTLQILALRDGEPTVTSLIYSLESVFGLISGIIVLGERPSMMALAGCMLMFIAVLYSQIRSTKKAEPDGKTLKK